MNAANSVSIVRATLDHLESVVLLFDAYRQFYKQPCDPRAAEVFISERLKNADSVILLAKNDGTACGFTQLYPAFSSVALRRIWILNDLFVTPDARKVGVGRRLMTAAADFAVDSGAKRLVLATAVDNTPAQSLYETLGWVQDSFLHYKLDL